MPSRYQPNITKAPPQLIAADGNAIFGLFDGSVPQLNFADVDYRTVLDKKASAFSRHFHFKQFQFISVTGPDWLLAVAIADIRYASSGFAYLYQHGGETIEKGVLLPLNMGCQMSQSPTSGKAQLHFGQTRWSFDLSAQSWQLELDCGALQANLRLLPQQQTPLALCAPTGYQGLTYTEKNNALQVLGELKLAGKQFDLSKALGGYDFSAGFMRRQTNWRWASINSNVQGQPFGLNLANGVNETGLCENALWYQGAIQHLSPVQFAFSRTESERSWQVSTLCGEVELEFQPLYCRQEKVQAGLLASNFRQYVGYYQGRIQLADGIMLQLHNCLGLAEDHYAKW